MNSFSFNLFHHNSKLSPFYDQSKTESKHSKEAFIHSLTRLNRFNSSKLIDAKYVESELTIDDYFMNIYISESNERLVIPSMSSGLTWIQCDSCSSNCESQHQSLYSPKLSNTYNEILFDSKECKKLVRTKHGDSNECPYQKYHSGYNKFSSRVLGTETFYLESLGIHDESFSDIVFGCDEVHEGDFKDGVQGVVGLGQGPFSLVFQVRNKIGKNANKFSYCLFEKSLDFPSKIKLGSVLTLYNQEKKNIKLNFSPLLLKMDSLEHHVRDVREYIDHDRIRDRISLSTLGDFTAGYLGFHGAFPTH
ncbi:probable aspartic protease At2g35615 [Tripterygium wilfordii]|uniref:probable aspartic protease At2g35615 n=1 Tax=Tripterygium wilfordii TaxID=458696 RepID=UPI0018F830D3|nr:probable aspartic protease At2g35615 [Tripterygium wilfordii]